MKVTINANGREITVLSKGDENDFISLTDIARYKNPEFPADVVKNWMRNRNTIEFVGLWEQLNNPDFKLVEFDQFKNESGANAFVLSPRISIFSNLVVNLSGTKEQQKIASVLTAADKEIKTLQQKRACLIQEKKTLMQQLLTGRRRVKLDDQPRKQEETGA